MPPSLPPIGPTWTGFRLPLLSSPGRRLQEAEIMLPDRQLQEISRIPPTGNQAQQLQIISLAGNPAQILLMGARRRYLQTISPVGNPGQPPRITFLAGNRKQIPLMDARRRQLQTISLAGNREPQIRTMLPGRQGIRLQVTHPRRWEIQLQAAHPGRQGIRLPTLLRDKRIVPAMRHFNRKTASLLPAQNRNRNPGNMSLQV